jgi:hypothetical protein
MTAISEEELAAVVVALNAVAHTEQSKAENAMPAWRRAMRAESVMPFDE